MNDIHSWLRELGLEQYAQVFADNGISRQALPYITEQDLVELGVLLGHRRLLLAAIAKPGNESPPATGPNPGSNGVEAAAPPEEHRQVSVLFADLVGFTRISEQLEPEAVHRLLACFLDEVDQVIIDHGGTVDKHLGDCVMGLFGAPVSHGNDSARALHAALEILRRMPDVSNRSGRSLGVHIGIANGQVVASGVGRDTHYTVTGDSVNLASRLTDAAAEGEVLVSDGVRSAVADAFEFEDRGEMNLRGMSCEIHVFALLGAAPEAVEQEQRVFVGRQAEIEQFSGMARACQETGSGQAVYLRGEAGIGKTSLGKQFEKIAADQGYDCHRALVLDFGMGREQSVERTLVRSLLKLPAHSDLEQRQAVLERAMSANLVRAEQRVFLNELLAIPQTTELSSLYDAMDAQVREQGMIDVIIELLHRCSQQRAQLILVEDVHWADEALLQLLARVAGALVDHSCLLVMTSRIEGDPLSPGWKQQIDELPFVTLELRPLRSTDANALAREYLGGDHEYVRQCVERAAGNPLYLEQLLRNSSPDKGGLIPGSIQSIVQSRLDSLATPDRQAIQAASVLGQRFGLSALRHVLDQPEYGVDALVNHNLVRVEGTGYLFSHALVQEAVYQSLLRSRKAALHIRAAQWFGEDEPELRARHLDRAADPGAALAYHKAAQAKLQDLHFNAGLDLAQRGLELAREDPERCRLLLSLSRAQRHLGDAESGTQASRRALELAGDDELVCQAWLELAENLRLSDKQPQALDALKKAQARAEAGEMDAELSRIHYLRGNLYFMTGDIQGCLQAHRRSLALAEQIDSAEAIALALGGLGDADYLRGHMRSARDRFQACVNLSRKHAYGQIEVANRNMVGWSRLHLMEFDEALDDAQACVRMAKRAGHFRAELVGVELIGLIELERGRLDQAHGYLERTLTLAEQLDAANFIAQARFMLARLAIAKGNFELARQQADQALAIVRRVGTAFAGPAVLATCAVVSEDESQQARYLDEALEILDRGCVSHNYFHFARIAIDLCLEQRRWSDLERYAELLLSHTSEQPLEWSDFLVDRGRALAAWQQGNRTPELLDTLRRLKARGTQVGIRLLLVPVEAALDTVQLHFPGQ